MDIIDAVFIFDHAELHLLYLIISGESNTKHY